MNDICPDCFKSPGCDLNSIHIGDGFVRCPWCGAEWCVVWSVNA